MRERFDCVLVAVAGTIVGEKYSMLVHSVRASSRLAMHNIVQPARFLCEVRGTRERERESERATSASNSAD